MSDLCPYTGFKKKCETLRHQCPKWVHITGQNPQTGASVDEWACSDKWTPVLLVENARKLHELGAAVESQRNVLAAGIAARLKLEATNER